MAKLSIEYGKIKKDYKQINIANKKVVDYVFENILSVDKCQ